MAYVRKHKRKSGTYYELVESYRDDEGKTHKRSLQWLGTNPEPPPDPVELSGLHFGVLATQFMDGTLTPTDVFDLLERIGKKPTPLPELEAVGISFNFQKKLLTLTLYPKQSKSTPPKRAPRAKKPGASKKQKPAHD